ncbi:hypothetical protein DYB28_005727 [Aphanomyces astaci]|uniref:Uncharacterized protein n=1 Tax=Aphanomyces astaci TaxID=112090 RepID=A0A9X8E0H2_APHAT|nr:hypothetical protein DYB28_005727 [Aphanomyces astaci]
MEGDGKKRKASEIAEDAGDSVEVAEVPVPQEEVVYLKAESNDVGTASVKRVAVRTQAKVKGEAGGPERTGLTPDEVFERELGFHWDRSRIFTPAGWRGVDLGYVRSMSGGSSFAMMRHCLSTL